MRRGTWTAAAATLAIGLGLGGCGVTDRVTGKLNGEEFAEKFTDLDQRADAAGADFADAMAGAKPNQELTPEMRTTGEDAFNELERVADDLDDLKPPDDAEDAVDELVEGTREAVDAAREVLADPDATVGELIAALQANDLDAERAELTRLGYAAPESD